MNPGRVKLMPLTKWRSRLLCYIHRKGDFYVVNVAIHCIQELWKYLSKCICNVEEGGDGKDGDEGLVRVWKIGTDES